MNQPNSGVLQGARVILIEKVLTGTRLELEVYTDKENKIDINFVSMFEQMLDEQYVLISAPLHEGSLYPIRVGWAIDVYFFHDEKLYMFESRVIDRPIKSNMSFLKLEMTSSTKHIQRRDYFRFKCTLPIEYRKVDYSCLQVQKDENPFNKSLTKNLSGGGVCIFLNESIDIHQLVECRIKLEDNKVISFLGRIIRIRKLEQAGKYQYETGVAFEIIENNDKEAIIKYIFKQERKLRSKGII